MFLVSKVQGTQITILDTVDGLEEEFTESELRQYENIGLKIDGVGRRIRVSDNLQSFSKTVAKSILLGKEIQAGVILKDQNLVDSILSNRNIEDEAFTGANITIAKTVDSSVIGGITLNCYVYVDNIHNRVVRKAGFGRRRESRMYLPNAKFLIVSHKDGQILSAVMGKNMTDSAGNIELEFKGYSEDNVIKIEVVNTMLQVELQKYQVPEMCYMLRNVKRIIGQDLQYTFFSIFNNKELEVKRIV